MRFAFAAVAVAGLLAARADYLVWEDSFRTDTWRAMNTADRAKARKGVMTLSDDRRYLGPAAANATGSVPSRDCLPGTRFRFSVEARGGGEVRLGFLLSLAKTETVWDVPKKLEAEFRPLSFEYVLEENAKIVHCALQGAGEYRNARLERIVSPGCELRADPPYQLVDGEPGPVRFELFRNGVRDAAAEIVVSGLMARERTTGTTAEAVVERETDVSAFRRAAEKVRIDRPVSILYLGDSLTHYDLGRNHVDRTGYFLGRANPGKVSVFNYACGGDTIVSVMDRMDGKNRGRWRNRYADLWSRPYDWAFVLLGHNDTKASSTNGYATAVVPPDVQKREYRRLIARLREKGVRRIVLMSSTCSNFEVCKANSDKAGDRPHNRFGEPRHQLAFNAALRQVAEETGVEYMDVYSDMAARADRADLVRPSDGVHLTDKGHDFIALRTLDYLGSKTGGK